MDGGVGSPRRCRQRPQSAPRWQTILWLWALIVATTAAAFRSANVIARSARLEHGVLCRWSTSTSMKHGGGSSTRRSCQRVPDARFCRSAGRLPEEAFGARRTRDRRARSVLESEPPPPHRAWSGDGVGGSDGIRGRRPVSVRATRTRGGQRLPRRMPAAFTLCRIYFAS